MNTRRFMMTVLLAAAFVVPSLAQAWSFIETENNLSKSAAACWQITRVQDTACVGDDCPPCEGENCPETGAIELPSEAEEEPDCE